jgi:hypothetical protein
MLNQWRASSRAPSAIKRDMLLTKNSVLLSFDDADDVIIVELELRGESLRDGGGEIAEVDEVEVDDACRIEINLVELIIPIEIL